mmetsp:Transcript_10188/g.8994  ORF Transcript_10188/g.8994 Transcript_10188/m.8994 type:complete len:88 (-) Transcript_10188:1842-2105(-)
MDNPTDHTVTNQEDQPIDVKKLADIKKRERMTRNSSFISTTFTPKSKIPKPNFSCKISPEKKRANMKKGNDENSIPSTTQTNISGYS